MVARSLARPGRARTHKSRFSALYSYAATGQRTVRRGSSQAGCDGRAHARPAARRVGPPVSVRVGLAASPRLRARSRIPSHFWPPIHPEAGGVRPFFTGVEYCPNATSSRLVSRAPRRPEDCELFLTGPSETRKQRRQTGCPARTPGLPYRLTQRCRSC